MDESETQIRLQVTSQGGSSCAFRVEVEFYTAESSTTPSTLESTSKLPLLNPPSHPKLGIEIQEPIVPFSHNRPINAPQTNDHPHEAIHRNTLAGLSSRNIVIGDEKSHLKPEEPKSGDTEVRSCSPDVLPLEHYEIRRIQYQ